MTATKRMGNVLVIIAGIMLLTVILRRWKK